MKSNINKITAALIFTVLFALAPNAAAQGIFDSIGNKVKNKAKQKVDREVDRTIDEADKAVTNGVKNSDETQENANNSIKTQNSKSSSTNAVNGKPIWGFAAMTVQVRDKFGKQFSRVYVSEIAEVSDKFYKSKYNTDPSNFKPFISKYFKETVIAAAKERGEEVSEPDDYSLVGMTVKFSVESYIKEDFYTTAYRYNAKSTLDAPRQEQVDYAKNANRQLYFFNWDPSGKNIQADLEKERKRTSGELPN